MLLPVRSIAVSVAVVGFFGASLVGLASGVSPETCSKRGLIAAVAGYVVASLVVRVLNAILTQAVISNWVKQQEEQSSDNQ